MNHDNKLNNMISDLRDEIDNKLNEIARYAREHDLYVSISDFGPTYETVYLANDAFLGEWGWEESDLTNRRITKNDWISSSDMEW